MRKAGRVGRTVTLRFRFDDFTRATRSHSLPDATRRRRSCYATALGLLDANWGLVEERGITLFGVSVGNLHDEDAVQLALPFERSDADRSTPWSTRFATGSDRRRCGAPTTMRGDPGFTVPMLPD